jgi:hypothetical protein
MAGARILAVGRVQLDHKLQSLDQAKADPDDRGQGFGEALEVHGVLVWASILKMG